MCLAADESTVYAGTNRGTLLVWALPGAEPHARVTRAPDRATAFHALMERTGLY